MIQAVVRLLFGCRHRRVTRPITPVHKSKLKPKSEHSGTYVTCLDCGQQFHYDITKMRMGAAMPKASGDRGQFQTSN